VRVAGNEMDEAIIQYVKMQPARQRAHRRQVKFEVGSAFRPSPSPWRSRAATHRHKTLTVTDAEIREALQEPVSIIVNWCASRSSARRPSSARTSWTQRRLSPAGSLLKHRPPAAEETGLPVSVAEDPLARSCWDRKMLSDFDLSGRSTR
jgi:rod shape-determining protein MreB